MAAMDELCATEIEELHHFFETWLTGRSEKNEGVFARCRDVMADGFELVNPSGRSTDRDTLCRRIFDAHGISGEPLRIWTENYQGRMLGDRLHLTTYEEWQETGEQRRGRLATAIFRLKPDAPEGVEWIHVHETWLPSD